MPGAYTKKDIRKVITPNLVGFEVSTGTLDGTTTTETLELACPASKITLQSTGDLAYDYTVSVNGENFVTGASVAAGALSSYNTHNVSKVRITRTSGSGRVSIACVS